MHGPREACGLSREAPTSPEPAGTAMVPERTAGVSCGPRPCCQALQACPMWSGEEALARVRASPDRQPSPLALHGAAGVQPQGPGARGEALAAREATARPLFGEPVRAEALERHHRQPALQQGRAHKGSPGRDGMRVAALPDWRRPPWPGSPPQLLEGPYQPRVMERGERAHPGSQEKRPLGMPGVLDRLSQHALRQGGQWRGAPTFSESRDGFRPGRPAPQAGAPAPASLAQGGSIVVALDVETCCAQVCQDRLRSRLAQQRAEKRVRQLIRASLHAGRLANGVTTVPEAGTPPGAPLAPCRSHVVWDEGDKALERRGPRGCRSADASNSDVRSRRAGGTGHGPSQAVHAPPPAAQGAWAAERRRPPPEPPLPGGQLYGGEVACSTERCPKGPRPVHSACQSADETEPRAEPAPRHHDAASVSARMEGLLWLLPNAHGVAGGGQLDTPSAPMPPMATLESVPATAGETDQAGGGLMPGAHDRVEWQRSMVYQPDPRGTLRFQHKGFA
jgi:retron-type reverse transcriptase